MSDYTYIKISLIKDKYQLLFNLAEQLNETPEDFIAKAVSERYEKFLNAPKAAVLRIIPNNSMSHNE